MLSRAPGRESVWDYPRPPRLERVSDTLRVVFAGETIAETVLGYRVLETSHPPVYTLRRPTYGRTSCPQKLNARFVSSKAWPGTGRSMCGVRGQNAPPGAIPNRRNFFNRSETISLSTHRASTNAGSGKSECSHKKAISMAAGSRRESSGHLRAGKERSVGDTQR